MKHKIIPYKLQPTDKTFIVVEKKYFFSKRRYVDRNGISTHKRIRPSCLLMTEDQAKALIKQRNSK